jgi:hypothetical protein
MRVRPERRLAVEPGAQAGMPDRDGVTFQSPLAGPGTRGHGRLRNVPCLQLVADEGGEVGEAGCVAPFVVVPAEYLD